MQKERRKVNEEHLHILEAQICASAASPHPTGKNTTHSLEVAQKLYIGHHHQQKQPAHTHAH